METLTTIEMKKEKTMSEITTVGLDLAKNVFHVVYLDRHGREVSKKMLRRNQVLGWFANLPPCLVGMEACAGSHYWARELQALGHEVRLIPAQHVKAYVRGQKNDYNDARAIAEALGRPGMRFVPPKSQAQQDIQALHRLRSGVVDDRTALCNQLRGLLAEYGIVVPKAWGACAVASRSCSRMARMGSTPCSGSCWSVAISSCVNSMGISSTTVD